jgi:hypothetical protein
MILSNHVAFTNVDPYAPKENRPVGQIPNLYKNYQKPQSLQYIGTDRPDYYQNGDFTPKYSQVKPSHPNSKMFMPGLIIFKSHLIHMYNQSIHKISRTISETATFILSSRL